MNDSSLIDSFFVHILAHILANILDLRIQMRDQLDRLAAV